MAFQHRQDAVGAGLMPPEADELPQLFRTSVGEVFGFGEILVGVVQLPFILFKARRIHMVCYGLPAVAPDAAIAQHLVILDVALGAARRNRQRSNAC